MNLLQSFNTNRVSPEYKYNIQRIRQKSQSNQELSNVRNQQNYTRRIRDVITKSIHNIRNKTRKIRPNTTESIITIPNPNKRTTIQPDPNVRSFLYKPTSMNIRTFLDKICPNTGQCISFGVETDKIRRYFNDFDFSLSIMDEREFIGSPSKNGFIIEIPFIKDNYKLYSILKSAITENADNLYYEALVGIFINKKNDIFPCFLETYGSYYWPEEYRTKYTRLLKGFLRVDLNLMKRNPLNYDFFLQPENIKKSYYNSKFNTILIQHIHNAVSLQKYVHDYKRVESFFSYHLVQYLYQIYCPLAMMSNEFTHYDLHTSNIMLYTVGETLPNSSNNLRPPNVVMKPRGFSALEKLSMKKEILDIKNNKQYITMKYHYPTGEIIEFNTFNIVKILDYGRSFFYDNMSVYETKLTGKPAPKKWIESTRYNSSHFYQLLTNNVFNNDEHNKGIPTSKASWSQDKFAHNRSYRYFTDEKYPGENFYITPHKRNKSHDLRLCDIIRKTPNKYNGPTSLYLREIFDQVVFEDTFKKQLIQQKYPDHKFESEIWFGTPEIDGISFISLHNSNSKIQNVDDIHLALKDLITNIPYFKQMNDDLFKSSTKIGEIHIWVDGSRSLRYVK
jgi:hypothetical protein